MSQDPFDLNSDSIIAPARLAFAIVPSDSANLPTSAKAVYVGSGGDITLRAVASDEDVTFRNVASGSVLAVRLKAVRQTGTTADHLVGLV